EEADMALRDAAAFGKFELAQSAAAAPLPHQGAETVARRDRGRGCGDAGRHADGLPALMVAERPAQIQHRHLSQAAAGCALPRRARAFSRPSSPVSTATTSSAMIPPRLNVAP